MPRFPHPLLALAVLAPLAAGHAQAPAEGEPSRPNILWLTSEDHGPQMGCYGDRFAATPHVDALAAKGMRYTRAWSNAPVCAPARTTIISGLYPPATGSEHMRSMVPFPRGKQMFPQLLRAAGYYCTNNAKEDYNLAKTPGVWDLSSRQAHWRNRKAGQPFFAVFNSEKSHESKLRIRPHAPVHDPAGVRVPAYHPDTPEVRQDWAQYYDTVTEADADAGAPLKELEAAGLAEDTIVFYYADHGSGMPRHKRSACNSGLQVPLVVYFPPRWRHLAPPEYRPGGTSDRLVGFVDLAPTLLSLAGIRPPDWMQGHAFMGRYAGKPQPFLYGFRGRMDERYDLVRSVTDGRYVYVRNYQPHRPAGQPVAYMFQTPTTAVWKRLYDQGRLTPEQAAFWKPKAPEELYDLRSDPDEVRNLAARPEHREALKKLRAAHREWAGRILDVGLLPEGEMKARAAGASPYDMAREEGRFPFRRILETADRASGLRAEELPALRKAFSDPDSAVRFWAAQGVLMRGAPGLAEAGTEVRAALKDPSPYVRVAAAETLARHGAPGELKDALAVLMELAAPDTAGRFESMAALHAIDDLGEKAASLRPRLQALAVRLGEPGEETAGNRYQSYPGRLLQAILKPAARP